jgi:hypothetical protein
MLQALLADRFNLVFHKEERPLSAYALTAPKGKQKLKEADDSGDTGCRMSLDQPRPADPAAGPTPPTISYTCRNMTMAAFAAQMTSMLVAQQFIGTNPVQDKTGLEGKWEFSFKYTLPLGGAAGAGITLPDALEKQAGLKLEQETMSLPVIVVEKASRPTPNEPNVAQKIPAFPSEFEVATVKPFALPGAGSGPIAIGMRMQPGGRVRYLRTDAETAGAAGLGRPGGFHCRRAEMDGRGSQPNRREDAGQWAYSGGERPYRH